jgi:3-oxoacyl-[acyl-carrier-protein] synthase II
MSNGDRVAITGCGVYIPGIRDAAHFLRVTLGTERYGRADGEPSLPWRGLRYKDRATKLALAAAKAALEDAQLPFTAPEQQSGDSFGVVVSSNLGNVDTVCRALDTIRNRGVPATSPMDLPNCSSNVIASTIAICAGLRGLNLMLCNGTTSGTDALYIGMTAIRAGRASRMLVVGVEPGTSEAARVMSTVPRRADGASTAPGEGAGAVLLESTAAAAQRSDRALGYLARCVPGGCADLACSLARLGARTPDLWFLPAGFTKTATAQESTSSEVDSARQIDLTTTFGDLYGATGVLQAVAATLWLGNAPAGSVAGTTGTPADEGFASFLMEGRTACGQAAV